MVRLPWLVALTFFAVLDIKHADADVQTGRTFWSMCQGQESGYFCNGYVIALFDQATEQSTPCQFYFPGGTDAAQIYDVVMKYLREFPEHRGWKMSAIVPAALTRAFPCP